MGRSLLTLLLVVAALVIAVAALLWAGLETDTVDPAPAPLAAQERRQSTADPAPALSASLSRAAAAEPLVSQTETPAEEPARSAHLLRHSHEEAVRLAAAELLAEWVPGPGEAALLAACAGDDSLAVREQALRSLDGAEGQPVLDAYAEALRHPDLWMQDAGESGLYRLDDRDAAVATLARLCADPDRDVRLRAAELLDEMNAGPLAWDDLYDGPVQLAWAPGAGATDDTTTTNGDDG